MNAVVPNLNNYTRANVSTPRYDRLASTSSSLGNASFNSSNYLSNVLRGSQASPGVLGDSFVPSATPFAQEALASANQHAGLRGLPKQFLGKDDAQFNPLAVEMGVVNSISSGLTGLLAAGHQAEMSRDFAHNISQHGVAVEATARNVASSQQSAINYGLSGAALGSLLGPLGSLGGYFLGHYLSPQNPEFKIGSFSGPISPNNSGIAQSHNSNSEGGKIFVGNVSDSTV